MFKLLKAEGDAIILKINERKMKYKYDNQNCLEDKNVYNIYSFVTVLILIK